MAQIFISYAREDFEHAQALHCKLVQQGFRPWMDKVDLMPGQKWRTAIERAIQRADFFLLLLSRNSVRKRGFVQREIRAALDFWQEKLEEDIYLIPVLLEAMAWEEVPDEINEFQWVELYEAGGWEQLVKALEFEAGRRGIKLTAPPVAQKTTPTVSTPPPPPTSQTPVHRQAPQVAKTARRTDVELPTFAFTTLQLNARGEKIEERTLLAGFFVEDLGNGVKLEMVYTPGGEFLMGAPKDEADSFDDELPQHRVNVSAFFMGKFQVTQAQWRAVAQWPKVKLGLPPMPAKFVGDERPVERVSWHEAQEFCARLAQRGRKAYRLPSEAEWEYACRAGTTTPFAFGATITPEIVNYDGKYPYAQAPKGKDRFETVPVGSLGMANAFGLFDMHGNVWEWCEDVWHENYNGAPSDGSAWLSGGDSSRRVLRGGSWNLNGRYCRAALRDRGEPGVRGFVSLGFRVVVSARTP